MGKESYIVGKEIMLLERDANENAMTGQNAKHEDVRVVASAWIGRYCWEMCFRK